MKTKFLSVITLLITLISSLITKGQSFGISASAVYLSDCNQSNFFNTSGSGAALIGPSANTFSGYNFGVHTQNSGTLILRGGAVTSAKTLGVANVCSARMYYRVYLQSAAPGAFNSIDLINTEDCNTSTNQFSSGSSCSAGDQRWSRVTSDGTTTPYAPVNLTAMPAGNYYLEVYYEATGSSTSTTLCDENKQENNSGAYFKASFSIQAPVVSGTNPTTCNGTEGSITISGLAAGTTYSVKYSDDGVMVGPNNYTANGSGQIILTGLNAGLYADFTLAANGCSTDLNTGLILSNPLTMPTFTKINPFCAGSTPPTLPTTSNNGITGTWNPSVIDNQISRSYTFTPNGGQCGIPVTINVTVTPNVTPTFSFGTSLTICDGGTVPTLPNTSTNGVSGTWSPATVDNHASGTYTFTPTAGQCALPATFTVTVTPNVTPTFSFGTALTICAGGTVPTLPTASDNGVNGTWSPSVVDNQNSATYTFTPSAGQCALPVTFNVTVNPNTTPTFSFGTTLTICAGGSVPTLPATSDNGVNGSWSPATVDNQNSATYTFTPAAGQCAVPATFTVTVTPNVTPTFTFGTSLTICAGGTVPALPTTSGNGITGTWSPATVDNQNSATYTFTPDAGQCALPANFVVTVNPNVTPTFSFGTSLTICAGGAVPSLPTTSDNGITGAWSPAAIDNQASATYTFTPSAGQCALPVTLNVTVNPNTTPTFSFGASLTICDGGSVPTLPTTSDNGVNGSWNPAVVDNHTSGTYTFTPTAGQCALPVTFTVTVNSNVTPVFTFGTSLTICAGGTVPALPTTSGNGITGTWSPAIVDNQNSATYTFTPDAGQCAVPATFVVTVNPNMTPTFSFGTTLTICAGGTVPSLVTTSDNGITGTWSPATIDNQTSATYTFTPGAGQCALPTSLNVTVNPNTTPAFSFGPSLTICDGGSVPTLPGTSDNGVNGSWSPATVDNHASGTYTFTPTAGQCATPVTFTVTVNSNVTPTFSFGTALTVCAGGAVPSLPTTSSNGITGTWNPATVDNQNSATYTFTPAAGQCALPTNFTVTVTPNVTPTFSFGAAFSICAGTTVAPLPTTSTNGITGTWSPATVDNQNSGTYTFTPGAGQCAVPTTLNVTVNPNTTPTFSFGPTLTICDGSSVPALPTTSDNGISGTWSPATVDNHTSGTYTFTPSAAVCATPVTFAVTVNPNVTPGFSFGTSQTICAGSTAPVLPTTSTNGITGTWSPSTVDNQNSATYTFTPAAGQCAVSTSFAVTVTPNVTPTFSFGTSMTTCAGSAVPTLSTTSSNGISGSWSPSTVSNQNSATYTFTPAAGQCAVPVTFNVTITPNTVPVFSFGTTLTICDGGTIPVLPTTSTNGVNGSWSPAVVDNHTSGVYTFTPVVAPGQCIITTTFTVTVKPILTPTFSFGNTLTLCSGSTAPVLATTSTNGVTGTWNPAVINNQAGGTYTFTTGAGQCAAPSATLTVAINPTPVVNLESDTTVTDGTFVPAHVFKGAPAGLSFNWTNSNTSIGLGASGTGNVPSFTAINKGSAPAIGVVSVTPALNGCTGVSQSYKITVLPLEKDVFVPNVFTPNGDGKNEILFVYGNYISKLDMRIFNQWGELVFRTDSKSKGWDGTRNGTAQPVGVYLYALEAVLTDGRTVKLNGNINLLR